MTAPRVALESPLLTTRARAFLDDLCRRFSPRWTTLLSARVDQQGRFDSGELPDFQPATADLRQAEWRVAEPPAALLDRRVEITGPAEAKMIVNALNSGARVFMADLEDSFAPTWSGVLTGHQALCEAVRGTLEVETPQKRYTLNADRAKLFVRPRGLHLVEGHYLVDGAPIPASLFDFGLYVFHNAVASVERGAGPWLYLPKLQTQAEARWWAQVFDFAERTLHLVCGTIRATVLIETLPAAFVMDEILYELRHWSVGLNCGRWDYIFSAIKTFRNHPNRLFVDRAQVGMDRAFLDAYSRRLIATCHRRGAHAMGGMSAHVPLKDAERNRTVFAKVTADKQLEVSKGHDGTWVAHPGLVPVAKEVFDLDMPAANQIASVPGSWPTRDEMLTLHTGTRTEAGLRTNLRVGVLYLESWLRGVGCVAIDGLMEDAATAEISRAQTWQWQRWNAQLDDGSVVTERRVADTLAEVVAPLADLPKIGEATKLFLHLCTSEILADFLTPSAYQQLIAEDSP